MTKHLVLEGFKLLPIAHVIDLDDDSIAAVSLGEQTVKLADLAAFATDQWPLMWAALKEQMTVELEKAKPPRAARRARNATTAVVEPGGLPPRLAAVPPPRPPARVRKR